MDAAELAEARGHIQKAREKAATARLLYDASRFDDCVSRAYYAMFHAGRAVLFVLGYKAKTHSGLIHLFKLHVTDAGLLPGDFARWLNFDKDLRENGDYETAVRLSREQAEEVLRHAQAFLAGVERYLTSAHHLDLPPAAE